MPQRGPSSRPAGMLRKLTTVALASVTLFGGAACGSDSEPESVASPVALTDVTVGVVPFADVAPIYLGKEKGYFRERGINLKLTSVAGDSAVIPGVASGEFDFGFGTVTSLMVAQTKRIPVQVVASGSASTGAKGMDCAAVVVNEDSVIKTPDDLEGKTIAVHSLKNIGDVTIRESVRKAGGDPDTIEFVEMPFTQMPAALADKRVDAAWAVEPFLAALRGVGGRPVAWTFVDTAKELTVAAYFTTAKLAQQDPNLVRRFVEAINESMRYANAHLDQVRAVLNTYLRVESGRLAALHLPNWPDEINRESLEKMATLAKQDGLFGNARVDLDELLSLT